MSKSVQWAILSAFVFFCIFGQVRAADPRLEKYISFLHGQQTPAKEYIFSLFEKHDIVLLCEGAHDERSQYELIYDIIADERFASSGGLLFTEIGMQSVTDTVNVFLQGPDLPEAELEATLLEYVRWGTMLPWSRNGSGYDLLKTLYTINRKADDAGPVWWYPTDVVYDRRRPDPRSYLRFQEYDIEWRDSLMAQRIFTVFDSVSSVRSGPTKALVIMNYRHAYGNGFVRDAGRKPQNTGRYLFERYGDRIANVLLHQLSFTGVKNGEGIYSLPQDGKWDAAFRAAGKRNIGFDLKGTPFGLDDFDNWILNKGVHTYQDVFNGYVFYNPAHEWVRSEGTAGFMEDGYLDRVIDYHRMEFRAVGEILDQKTEEFLQDEYLKWNIRVDEPYEVDLSVRDKWLENYPGE